VTLQAGQRVKHWRELRGISQLDLAHRAKMDPARLCRIENGKTKAKADEIERLAKGLDLSMPEFYGATDEAKAS
jgi:Predicted transcription factor, homolog of eukaryotic MBF1